MIMRMLIEGGGDGRMATKNTLTTPIHFAAREGNSRSLESLLLEIGKQALPLPHEENAVIELSKLDEHGNTPLLLAALTGWSDVVEVMLEQTRTFRDWALITNKNGNNAIQVGAYYSQSPRFLETLLADKHIALTINDVTGGRNALMLAVSRNNIGNVKTLIAHGAAMSCSACTATALEIAEEKGHVTLVNLLSSIERTEGHAAAEL